MNLKTTDPNQVLKSNIEAIRAVLAFVRTTIGPKGLDVMLVDEFGNSICTNDGIEILRNIRLQHPTAKLAVAAVESQEMQAGDGTTTCAVYIDSILAAAEKKLELGFKANRIAEGLELACKKATVLLEDNSTELNNDESLKSLINISARQDAQISDLVFQAVKNSDKGIDLTDYIVTSLNKESQVLDGIFIKKKSHFSFSSELKNAAVLLVEGPLEPEPMSSEAVSTEEGVKKYENHLQTLLDTAKKIIKTGCKVIITGSSIYPSIEEFFVKEGVLVLSHVSKKSLQILSKSSGANLLSRPKLIYGDSNSIEKNLGKIDLVSELKDCGGFLFKTSTAKIKSILISAQTQARLEERERITIDALKAAQNACLTGYVLGEGVAEMNIVSELENEKKSYPEDIQAGFTIMQSALKAILWQIIDNAGFSYKELTSQVNFNPENKSGFDLDSGAVIDLERAGIFDPLQSKLSALRIATEFCIQILRINAVVQAK